MGKHKRNAEKILVQVTFQQIFVRKDEERKRNRGKTKEKLEFDK